MPDTPDEELVRRLLADARHDAPVPADVAARLDDALEELAAERRAVTALPARAPRAHRRWGTALVAAAAVVAGGVTLRAVWPSEHGSSSQSSSSSAGSASAGKAADGQAEAPSVGGEIVDLHRATLAADVRRAVAARGPAFAATPPTPPTPEQAGCPSTDWGAGTAVAARLDGRPVVLVLRPPTGGGRVADVLACGSAEILASVTVPAG